MQPRTMTKKGRTGLNRMIGWRQTHSATVVVASGKSKDSQRHREARGGEGEGCKVLSKNEWNGNCES